MRAFKIARAPMRIKPGSKINLLDHFRLLKLTQKHPVYSHNNETRTDQILYFISISDHTPLLYVYFSYYFTVYTSYACMLFGLNDHTTHIQNTTMPSAFITHMRHKTAQFREMDNIKTLT